MATYSARKRSFPALLVVPLLLLFCLFPGQIWLGHFLPRLSGLATIDPGLNILHTPIPLPVSIDLILVPALFLLLYIIVILIDAIRRHGPIGRNLSLRIGAVLSGAFFLLLSLAIGGLISYILLEQLPGRIQNSISAIGMNADIHLPFLGYKTNSLHGNILSLLGLLIGIAIFVAKISKAPRFHRPVPLTREQRMTPYQRMLQERRDPLPLSPPPGNLAAFLPQTPGPIDAASPYPPRIPPGHCHNEPLLTLEPEAVNYRPLG